MADKPVDAYGANLVRGDLLILWDLSLEEADRLTE